MSKYLFIETRDPFEHSDATQTWELAENLAKKGNDVAFFLVQNGVFASRKGAKVATASNDSGVTLYVDDISLVERGINSELVREGITVSNIDTLVDLTLEDGRKAIWT
jgi:predicted peroxiredoxin